MKVKKLLKILAPFIISSAAIYSGLYYFTPIVMNKGFSFISAYFIFFHIPLFLLLIASILYYRNEGNLWNLEAFKARLKLRRMTRTDWIWAIGLFLTGTLFYFGFSEIGNKLTKIPFLAPPDFFPAEINPNKEPVSGYMFDYCLHKKYWVIPAYFFAWATNILGEEFMFRGILFNNPGNRKAWVFHAILWTGWHFFWKWNLISILPFSIALYYTFYRRKNLWITIFAHGLMNFIPLILITIEIFK